MPKVNYPATIAPNMFLVRCNCEKFTAQFMYYFMTLDAFTRQVDNISASSATKLLNKTNFRKLSILRPDLKEQKIIGKILKNIDNKIQTEETLLQKYQSIKRGLMGDLLGGRKEV
jgi:type I restriction enzyme S subunit